MKKVMPEIFYYLLITSYNHDSHIIIDPFDFPGRNPTVKQASLLRNSILPVRSHRLIFPYVAFVI